MQSLCSFLKFSPKHMFLPRTQFEKETKDPSATKAKPRISPMPAKPLEEIWKGESSDCSTDLEATYVSETDLDITEVETLPYIQGTKCPEPEPRSGAAQEDRGLRNTDEGVLREKQTPEDATEEDDAIRLVREIFFT